MGEDKGGQADGIYRTVSLLSSYRSAAMHASLSSDKDSSTPQEPSIPPTGRSKQKSKAGPFLPSLQPLQKSKAGPFLPSLQPLSITKQNLEGWPAAGSDDIGVWPNSLTPKGQKDHGKRIGTSNTRPNVFKDSLELQLKMDKLAYYDKECSRVAKHIYLGSDAVAKNREVLRANGITHVLNCVGFICPEYFKTDLVYKTLWLQDSPCEDITSILYDVFDYFEKVRELGGKVFVHCCQGVSRSTSLVIAYLMWRKGQTFEDAFQYVKAAGGVTNPNMGFASQLVQCQKRVHACPVEPNSLLRMYRMAPHSSYAPLHLVPKTVNESKAAALDSRGAFILQIHCAIYLWIGQKCNPVMEKAAKSAALQFIRYERAQGQIIVVREGEEIDEFWDVFDKVPIIDGLAKGEHYNCEGSILEGLHTRKDEVKVVKEAVAERRVKSYDIEYELFTGAVLAGVVPPISMSDTETGTHLPARENVWDIMRRKLEGRDAVETVDVSFKDKKCPDEANTSTLPSPYGSQTLPFLKLVDDSKSPSFSTSSLQLPPSPSSSTSLTFSLSQSPSPVSTLPESYIALDSRFKVADEHILPPSRCCDSLMHHGTSFPLLQSPSFGDNSVYVLENLSADTQIPIHHIQEQSGKEILEPVLGSEYLNDNQCMLRSKNFSFASETKGYFKIQEISN